MLFISASLGLSRPVVSPCLCLVDVRRATASLVEVWCHLVLHAKCFGDSWFTSFISVFGFWTGRTILVSFFSTQRFCTHETAQIIFPGHGRIQRMRGGGWGAGRSDPLELPD